MRKNSWKKIVVSAMVAVLAGAFVLAGCGSIKPAPTLQDGNMPDKEQMEQIKKN